MDGQMTGNGVFWISKAARHDCPSFHDHTPCPEGYIEWHAWAKRMSRTHQQDRCPSCKLLTIWVPKPSRSAE